MNRHMRTLVLPADKPKYLFFGGKGGVGKTTLITTTAVWLADRGHKTAIVSTDPTVSLSAMFAQVIGGDVPVPFNGVPNLWGLNVNPHDAKGVFKRRLDGMMGQMKAAFGPDGLSTPCAEEMATFDQFVSFLGEPGGDVVVFDTAPTGKSLRELVMPFDWAGFMQKQIEDGEKFARLMNMDVSSFEELEKDNRRYDAALGTLRDRDTSVFVLVLLPERLPIEETQSALNGLGRLGIAVRDLVANQLISPEVIGGNQFLAARAKLQSKYHEEIETRFPSLLRCSLPLLDRDISDQSTLRHVGELLYGAEITAENAANPGRFEVTAGVAQTE